MSCPAEAPIESLRHEGIRCVVNCTREGMAGDTVECAHDSSGEVEYCRVGVLDIETAEILPYLGPAARWINAQRAAGKGVLVHCRMGRSRSATVTISALMEEGLRRNDPAGKATCRDDAYRQVKGARPCADPNQGFWDQLALFQQQLQGEPPPPHPILLGSTEGRCRSG